MGKFVLETEYDFDFQLLGLVSPFRDYRLCWLLNKTLEFDFTRKSDLEVHLRQKRKLYYFSLFSHYDALNKWQFYFIANKSANYQLIPEFKQMDYFLLWKGTMLEADYSGLVKAVKGLQAVQAVMEINPLSLKSKENLIFDESDV